ncbi:hypothetical protein QMK33_13420 [Hymenobacter sp. H14-R3]|uniref:hypothetical protein n=1 Tax=Hymenobacter sp. H14-R3 TaxID=3046308 RepID=UPI0024BBAC89|nr:hypothetical protein [Hymenobacter sp. H14-R3]MDJ0366153.1 hypothetical protein [Hymenobacter sp. H14-R3]
MKLLFATAALLGLAQAGYAQTAIKAGTIQLGGGVGYSRTSQDRPGTIYNGNTSTKVTDTYSQFSIAPSVGFFVADNLAVGINANYQSTNQNDARYFQAGAFVQYYQMVSEQFGFTGTLGGGYQHVKSSSAYDGQNGFYAGLTPGLVFFPIPKLAIGASIGGLNYSRLSYKANGFNGSDTYSSSTFGANFGLSQLLFSGTYYFGR